MFVEPPKKNPTKRNSVIHLSQSNLFKNKISKKTSRNKMRSFKSSFLSMSNSISKALRQTISTVKPVDIPFKNVELFEKLKCHQNTQLSIGIKKIEFVTPYQNIKSSSAVNIRNNKPKLKQRLELTQYSNDLSSSMFGIYYRGTNLKNKKLSCLRNVHNSNKPKRHKNTSVTLPLLREYNLKMCYK